MATGIIEINDAGLRFSQGDDILETSPGYAVLDGDRLLIGREGKANSRLLPRWTNNRFWNQLGTEPVANGTDRIRHHADLAFAHLESIWEARQRDVDRIIFAVPGFYSREQLGLLLGMAKESGIPVAGVVDTSVAAAATKPAGATILHLDIFLHRTTLTILKAETSLRRVETVTVTETGLFTLWDRWANIIAGQFIQTSRYDPMHQATSEQQLFDSLPEWIASRSDSRSTRFQLDAGSTRHEVAVSREQLLQACSTVYPQIVQVIRDHIPAGETATLLVADRFRGFPGLSDSLNLIGNAAVTLLDERAVAAGTQAFESSIASTDGAVSHTTSLPLDDAPSANETRATGGPTHVLVGTDARVIGSALKISGVEDGRLLTGGSPVCTIYSRGGETLLEAHGKSIDINGQATSGTTVLAPGDRVSLGDDTLTLITVSH